MILDQIVADNLRELEARKRATPLAEMQRIALQQSAPLDFASALAGISNEVIRHFGSRLPILGVCLGHQCVGYSYGGSFGQAREIMHGKSSFIHHNSQGVLAGLPNPFSAIRYHSLVVQREGLPDCLEVTAWTDDGTIMGLRHRQYPVESVQFHPESFMTEVGKDILRNFLQLSYTRNNSSEVKG